MLKNILSVDIGGTNSRFAHFELEADNLTLCQSYSCKTATISNTTDAIDAAASCGLSPHKADIQVWGIAGVVDQEKVQAKLTNGYLKLDFASFTKNIKPKAFILLNDFALQAWACLIHNLETICIFNPIPTPHACRAVLGAGTGLGTAAIVPNAKSYTVLQSEGGHTEMPLQTKQEADFAHFAKIHLNKARLSAEDILAAKGMSLLHTYESGTTLSSEDVATFWTQSPNSLGLNLYAGFLGRFCRHWALNTLCLGGLYLGGGVLNKNPEIFKNPHFANEFYLSPMTIINNIPVSLMTHANISLWGGAYAAKNILSKA